MVADLAEMAHLTENLQPGLRTGLTGMAPLMDSRGTWAGRLQRRYRRYRARRQYAAGPATDAIFVWIPKTAGTFLYRHLALTAGCPKLKDVSRLKPQGRLSGVVTFGHMHLPTLVAAGWVARDFYDRAFVFTLVRNPYTRAVSNFAYQKQQGRLPPEMSFETFCRLLANDGAAPIGHYNFSSLSQCNPQMAWLRDVRVDYVGRVEDMEVSAHEICRRLGVPAPADTRVKANQSVFEDYDSYLTADSIRWLNAYYKEDFEQFGYAMLSVEHMRENRSDARMAMPDGYR